MALTNPVLGVYASEKIWITGKDEHWFLIMRDKDSISGRCYDYVRNPTNGRRGHGLVIKENARIDGPDVKLTEDLGKIWPGHIDHVHDLAVWAQYRGRSSSRKWVIALVDELERQKVIESGHAGKLRAAYRRVQYDRQKEQRERWEKEQKSKAERNGKMWEGQTPPMFVGSAPDPSQWRRSKPTIQVDNAGPQPVGLDHMGQPLMAGQSPAGQGRSGVPPASITHPGVSRHDFGNGARITHTGQPMPMALADDSNLSVRSGRSKRSYQSTHSRRSEDDLGADHATRRGRLVNNSERRTRAASPTRSTRSHCSSRTDRSTRSRRAPSPARSTRSARSSKSVRSTKSARSTRSGRAGRSSAPSRTAARRTAPPSRAFSLGNLSRSFSRMRIGPRASRGRRVF